MRVKKVILRLLETSPKSKGELIEQVLLGSEKSDDVSQKSIEKAIQRLVRKQKIKESHGNYALVEEEGSSDEGMDEPKAPVEDPAPVPVAEILRRRAATKSCDSLNSDEEKPEQQDLDIDEEIRRLEAELGAEESSDSNSVSEDDKDESVRSVRKASFAAHSDVEITSTQTNVPADGPAIVCLSSLSEDRIAPLPSSCLPQTKKRILKGIDCDGPSSSKKKSPSNGLKDAAQEILSGYKARSAERLPFYCRVCSKQYSGEREFLEHRESDFHKVAVQMERKMSFCKVCRKEFTSPAQLKEHVMSRPHRERLEMLKSRNPPRRSRGSGGYRGPSRRQWC